IEGDLLAQTAANATGAARLIQLVRRTGAKDFAKATDTLIRTASQRLEQHLRALDGRSGEFEDVLEWSQDGEDVDLPVRVRLSIAGGRLTAAFSGTAAQVAGPVNATRYLTASCLIYLI